MTPTRNTKKVKKVVKHVPSIKSMRLASISHDACQNMGCVGSPFTIRTLYLLYHRVSSFQSTSPDCDLTRSTTPCQRIAFLCRLMKRVKYISYLLYLFASLLDFKTICFLLSMNYYFVFVEHSK